MVKNKTEALCKCPDDCSTDFEPVCGTNSKTYTNYCHLRTDSCKRQQKIRIEHIGVCGESFSNGTGFKHLFLISKSVHTCSNIPI